MSWLTNYLRVLGALTAFVAVGVFHAHPNQAFGDIGGVSAPPALNLSIESAPAARLVQSHFNWGGHALESTGVAVMPGVIRIGGQVRQIAQAPQPLYSPLHRRPPPSLS
jgi:hypothetical protein